MYFPNSEATRRKYPVIHSITKCLAIRFIKQRIVLQRHINEHLKTIIPQIKTGLAATVYTQVTDVEDELNGILTYDRKVVKIDEETIKEINRKVKL